MEKYIVRFLDLPDALPQSVGKFLLRYELRDFASDSCVNVSWALTELGDSSGVPVILDIDAYRPETLAMHGEGIWTGLEALRDLKNRCFFGSLTDDAVALYT